MTIADRRRLFMLKMCPQRVTSLVGLAVPAGPLDSPIAGLLPVVIVPYISENGVSLLLGISLWKLPASSAF